MKIGLLTYSYSCNYGAVLQCYATCKILQELGHDVEIISVKQEHQDFLRKIVFSIKNSKFNRFMKDYYPKRTEVFEDIVALKAATFDYDILLVGSDQVWNPNISGALALAFFLDFGKTSMKRISYASSFGTDKWDETNSLLSQEVNKALHNFHALSVRESTGVRILKEQFGLLSQRVLDPTMLLDDYSGLQVDIHNNNEIICYLLNRTPLQLLKAINISKKFNQKPRMISTIHYHRGFKYTMPLSINEWLSYISTAKFVITDSFHGLVFSLLFHKQFIVITPNNGLNSRLKDLIELVGLNDRFYNENDEIDFKALINNTINYELVDPIISDWRQKSLDYLINSIS